MSDDALIRPRAGRQSRARTCRTRSAPTVASEEAFIEKLLAPLPISDAVDEKRELLDLRRERKDDWHNAWMKFRCALEYRTAAWTLGVIARQTGEDKVAAAAEGAKREFDFLMALDAMMLTPAATKENLKLKEKWRKYKMAHAGWEEAIARDEAFLAQMDAAGCFQRRAV